MRGAHAGAVDAGALARRHFCAEGAFHHVALLALLASSAPLEDGRTQAIVRDRVVRERPRMCNIRKRRPLDECNEHCRNELSRSGYYHPDTKAYWIFNGSEFWSYDTPTSIASKTAYVKSRSLAGAMLWELSGDTTDGELISAVSGGLQ